MARASRVVSEEEAPSWRRMRASVRARDLWKDERNRSGWNCSSLLSARERNVRQVSTAMTAAASPKWASATA